MLGVFRLADKTLGTTLCLLLSGLERTKRLFKKDLPFDPGKVKKILVIKTVALGDLIVILPMLRALKETYPTAGLFLLTTPRVKEVVEGYPFLDQVIYFQPTDPGSLIKTFFRLKHERFSLVIEAEHYYRFTTIMAYLLGVPWRMGFSLPGQGRKGLFNLQVPYEVKMHEAKVFYQFAEKLGAERSFPGLEPVFTSPEDVQKVSDFLRKERVVSSDRLIILHPSTSPRARSRQWPSERWAELARALKEKGFTIIISGASGEEEAISRLLELLDFKPIVSAGKLTLKQYAVLLKKAALFIGVDTGVLHLAAAQGTPVVGLYGPNTPVKWGPLSQKSIVIYKETDCSPCTRQYEGVVSDCDDNKCMRQIEPGEVSAAALKLWEKNST